MRAGAWLDVRADMLVGTNAAEVLVLGPRGAPHGVPTSFDGTSAGPYFIARLPKGRYTVTAHLDDWNFSKDLAIGNGRDRVVFAWKRDSDNNIG